MNATKRIAIFLSLILIYCQTPAQVLEQDSLALVAFYNSTGGPNWNNNSGWLTGPVSTWYGITVEGNRVVRLGSPGSFAFNNLNGEITSEIGELTNLNKLTIGNNPGLAGIIPIEIGYLVLLEGLGIGNCSSLEFINLWENNLIGNIPFDPDIN